MKREISDNGTLITIDEWKENVVSGSFIDYDGFGHFATETEYDDSVNICPSQCYWIDWPKVEKYFTHILWFNR